MKTMYIVQDTRNKKYKIKSRHFNANMWVDEKEKAQLFKTKGAIKNGMYCYSINPDSRKLGAKIILPDWVKIIPVTVQY